jgi:DNA helicase INO80
MLRRLKKDVEQEIAPKVEETIYCDMTHRQRTLYNRIKMKISAADLFQLASSKAKMENLMNLVMQFRKVCNHPDLFERRMGKIPFTFCKMQTGMLQNMSLVTKPDIFIANTNPISFELPQLIYDECFMISDNNTRLFTKQAKGIDQSMITVSVETHFKLFNIFNSLNLHESIYG